MDNKRPAPHDILKLKVADVFRKTRKTLARIFAVGMLASTVLFPTIMGGEFHQEEGMSFGTLWKMYLDVQLNPGNMVKGKVYDFGKYCTPTPRGCGFNANDPNFDSTFHGHIIGYTAFFENGKWVYYENPQLTPPPPAR